MNKTAHLVLGALFLAAGFIVGATPISAKSYSGMPANSSHANKPGPSVGTPTVPSALPIAASAPIPVRLSDNKPLVVSMASSSPLAVHEVEKDNAADWGVFWATTALALITGALSIFTGLLWWWTKQLATSASKEATASAQRSEHALEAARTSAAASAAAVSVMRQQLATANSPKLALRLATVTSEPSLPGSGRRTVVQVKMLLENTGVSAAVVKDVGFHLAWEPNDFKREPAKIRSDGEESLPRGRRIEPGEIVEIEFSKGDFSWPEGSVMLRGGNGEQFVHLAGRIVYTDGAEITKVTAFYRVYSPGTHRFEPLRNNLGQGLEYSP